MTLSQAGAGRLWTAGDVPSEAAVAMRPGESIGVAYGSFLDQLRLIERGLPTSSIEAFRVTTGLPIGRVMATAGIDRSTYGRRKQSGRLSPGESERLLRLARTFEQAVDLFQGDRPAATQWLQTPIPALGNLEPIDAAQTEPGAREVEDLIGRIRHGVVS